jgi:hypothetical protein
MTVDIVFSTALLLGLAWRARWFGRGPWLLFVVGLILIGVAWIDAGVLEQQAENTAVELPPLHSLWGVWCGLSGIAVVVAAFGWLCIEQRREMLASSANQTMMRDAGVGLPMGGRMRPLEWVAVILLPVGGIVFLAGWLAVMLIIWTSRVWTYREKLLVTVAVPGGPLTALFVVDAVEALQWPVAVRVLLLAVTLPFIVVPTASAIYLVMRAKRRTAAIPSTLATEDVVSVKPY